MNKFDAIRTAYAKNLPIIMDQPRNGDDRFNVYFHDWNFTPIEDNVWQYLRGNYLPFFPQFPVLNYFIDFACPFKKIGVECDGEKWHNEEKDRKRDRRLKEEGWQIFRISGKECSRFSEEEKPESFDWRHFYLNTAEGIIEALNVQYFGKDCRPGHERFIAETLARHESTRQIILEAA